MWKYLILILEKADQHKKTDYHCSRKMLAFLQKECKKRNIILKDYQNIEQASKLLQEDILRQFFLKEELLILTDNEKIAKEVQKEGIAVVGYEKNGKYLRGISYIIQDLEAISLSYLEKVYARFHGFPLSITQTKRLKIREIAETDAEALYQMQREESIERVIENKRKSIEEERRFIKNYTKNQYTFYDFGFWAIEEKKSKKIIGKIGIEQHINREGAYLEFGYWIEKSKRRQGYAYEAGKAVLEFCKGELNISGEICCFVQPENIASQKTAQKLGFLKTKGIFNECYCCIKML